MSENFEIRLAQPSDTDMVLDLMAKANERVRKLYGEIQWTEIGVEAEIKAIEAGRCYVLEDNGAILATVVIENEDVTIWGNEGSDGKALYIQKMMAEPAKAGQGLGKLLIKFAAGQAIELNRPFIRLDCRASQTPLRKYYERQGFKFIRFLNPDKPNYSKVALYQAETVGLIRR